MRFNQIYALSLRHIYLISSSLPRIIDLIYWPTVQIFFCGASYQNFYIKFRIL